MINKILVIADMDEKVFSLEKSAQFAQHFDCKIDIVRFLPGSASHSDKESINKICEQLKKITAEIFNPEDVKSVSVEITDDIPQWINNQYSEETLDLIIKTGNRSENLFHTPLDWSLLHELRIPLLVLTDKKWKSQAEILATLDLQDSNSTQQTLNKNVVGLANEISLKTNSLLKACNVISVNTVLSDMDIVDKNSISDDERSNAGGVFAKIIDDTNFKQEDLNVLKGVHSKEILSFSNKIKADLVVMGTVGRSGINGFVFGNTAEDVLHKLRTDLLIVHATKD